MAKQTQWTIRVDLTEDERWQLKQVALARKMTMGEFTSKLLRRILKSAKENKAILSVGENDNHEDN